MKRLISTCLCLLLLYHTLSHVLVFMCMQWQDQHDLSERLTMYRTVDSLVEFFVPLRSDADVPATLTGAQTDGFAYKGNFYQVVRMDVRGDTLHILGYEDAQGSFWQQDLLAFIHDQVTSDAGASQRKADNLLKNFLKEYSSFRRSAIWFFLYDWADQRANFAHNAALPNRAVPIHSPPPRFV